jgi:hypothetical protein
VAVKFTFVATPERTALTFKRTPEALRASADARATFTDLLQILRILRQEQPVLADEFTVAPHFVVEL